MAFFLKLKRKYAWLPHIFFLDTNGTYKDLLSTYSFKLSTEREKYALTHIICEEWIWRKMVFKHKPLKYKADQ